MSDPKSRTIPPLRVSEKMRSDAESVLAPGETLSSFVMESVARSIHFRKAQQEFLARGMASAESARERGQYFTADEVLAELRAQLAAKKRRRR